MSHIWDVLILFSRNERKLSSPCTEILGTKIEQASEKYERGVYYEEQARVGLLSETKWRGMHMG
jgi:hypothetical protein